MILYITSHKTGEFLGTRDAAEDIKNPERFVIPPYHTTEGLPSEVLTDNEYWAYLDNDGEPVRDYTLGAWVKKEKQVEVTAYHKETQQTQKFDDKSLVTDEYTAKEPPTPYHDFVDSDWVANKDKALEAKRADINNWRTALEAEEAQTVLAIGSNWDAGPSARLRIDSTVLAAVMPPYWTDADNVDHEGMTLEDLKQVKIAISELGFAIHDRQRTMKKEVEALTDFYEILNYPVGWPQ
ncbi:coil containing protein [Vibrio phage 1.246.O._10N.261.54.E10]|nr:coil containing protein [Vibrio phage 1.246.O._10N.261.54.E10]